MNETHKNRYNSGNVYIDESLGMLESPSGKTTLALVNMKVACYLLKHKGEVVSRNNLFDAIWPNQDISDDTLTRAISDIRAALATISPHKHIQTLPKRGYRWNIIEDQNISLKKPPVKVEGMHCAQANDQGALTPQKQHSGAAAATQDKQRDADSVAQQKTTIETPTTKTLHLTKILLSTLMIALGVLVGSSCLVWAITQLSSKPITRVVILPADINDETLTTIAYDYNNKLRAELMKTKQVSVLSHAAIKAQQETPLTHYTQQYAIHRILETQIRSNNGTLYIHCQYSDARTATVLGSLDRAVPLRNQHQLFDIKSIVMELLTRHKDSFLHH